MRCSIKEREFLKRLKKKRKKKRNALRAKIKTSFCDITFIGNVIFFFNILKSWFFILI